MLLEGLELFGLGAGVLAHLLGIDGLSGIRFGSGLTQPGTLATDSDTLAKTYQINEKLTWLKGNHTVKFGEDMRDEKYADALRRFEEEPGYMAKVRRVPQVSEEYTRLSGKGVVSLDDVL